MVYRILMDVNYKHLNILGLGQRVNQLDELMNNDWSTWDFNMV